MTNVCCAEYSPDFTDFFLYDSFFVLVLTRMTSRSFNWMAARPADECRRSAT